MNLCKKCGFERRGVLCKPFCNDSITLAEWSKETGILPTHPTTEKQAVSVVIDHMHDGRSNDLWRLSDYVVSSCCGIVVWLLPRK